MARSKGRGPRSVVAGSLALVFGCLAVLGGSAPASAALERPLYTTGDRWTYVLEGTFSGFPGTTASEDQGFVFTFEGLVDLDVRGVGIESVEVRSRTTGFINGTFALPPEAGGGSASAIGTFTSLGTERWETEGYLPVESHANETYRIDVSYFVFTLPIDARIQTDAVTTVTPTGGFPLDVDETATAALTTELHANATITVFGNTTSTDNRTTVVSSWSREALGIEAVAVEAGTFTAYKLNQSLGSFPGIVSGFGVPGANETAYFSNDVGLYVKRVAYANGTPVAEARLKSYSYAHAAPQTSSLPWPALAAIAAAVVMGILLALWASRRKRRVHEMAAPPPPKPPVGDGSSGSGPGEGRAR